MAIWYIKVDKHLGAPLTQVFGILIHSYKLVEWGGFDHYSKSNPAPENGIFR